jgi:spore coat polysaccharide biosynthesis protein SpsF
LQRIAPDLTICEYIVVTLTSFPCVSEVRLAIARGPGDDAFVGMAERLGLAYLIGSEEDVLGRVIACACEAGATDVLRRTSEDPFLHGAMLEQAWCAHVAHGNDVTAVDLVPEGTGFEIFTVAALRRCDERGSVDDHEHVANYARFHQHEFNVEILLPEQACRRVDLRLTVDNPEDLILCRRIYDELGGEQPPIPLRAIVELLDECPELPALVSHFAHPQPIWLDLPQRSGRV